VICSVSGNKAPSAHDAGETEMSTFAADEDAIAGSNRSFFGIRRLKSSFGCQSCCGGGDCNAAYKGVEAGICCLSDPKRPYCCPARAQCAQVVGHCLRSSKVQHTTRTSRVSRQRHDSAYNSHPLFQSLGFIAVMVTIIGAALLCYQCSKAQYAAKPVMVPGQPGVGPGGVVYGQPVAGQPVAQAHCNGGGSNAALYGGTGFLGGLALGSMMMGPGWGWGGGYGHGYGYGPEAMTSETTMTDVRSEEFVGDGGGFDGGFGGGFGGDLGMFDGGGDFGGDFGGDW